MARRKAIDTLIESGKKSALQQDIVCLFSLPRLPSSELCPEFCPSRMTVTCALFLSQTKQAGVSSNAASSQEATTVRFAPLSGQQGSPPMTSSPVGYVLRHPFQNVRARSPAASATGSIDRMALAKSVLEIGVFLPDHRVRLLGVEIWKI